MFKYLIILLISVTMFINNAQACDNNRVSFSIGSYHTSTDYKPESLSSYNQVNKGLSFECGVTDNIYIDVGFYENSMYKTSEHIGFIWYKKYNSFELGSNMGIVTGYAIDNIIYVRPYIQFNSIRVGVIPKIDNLKTDGVITFEIILEI